MILRVRRCRWGRRRLEFRVGPGGFPEAHTHDAGSLTTPPFTEAVEWVVLERIFEAGPEQVRALNRIEGNNARHVQSLEGRKVDAQRSPGF
jgi:carbonic anhydrase